MKQNKQAYYAEIGRAFKEYERELTAILQTLKVAGIVDWDDAKPSPTLIKYQAMNRVKERKAQYGKEPILPTKAPTPDHFGRSILA